MQKFFSGLFRVAGILAMGIAIVIIVKWYILWLSYYFIGSTKPSVIVGILTFFLSPLAALADLFVHSFPKNTIDMWVQFLAFFVGGRVLLFLGDKMRDKN